MSEKLDNGMEVEVLGKCVLLFKDNKALVFGESKLEKLVDEEGVDASLEGFLETE